MGDRVYIVSYTGHDVTGLVGVKIRKGNRVDFPFNLLTKGVAVMLDARGDQKARDIGKKGEDTVIDTKNQDVV